MVSGLTGVCAARLNFFTYYLLPLLYFDPVLAPLVLVWTTFLGACIGSFLNVVVYRLPLGKSLSDPPSHCPKCGRRIRWYDNVPVFGWLWLRGRCRDCREPISPRYPLVEAAGAVVFGTITGLTLHRGGDASLSEFFCFVVTVSGLLVTLLAAGLIEKDGQKVPWRLFLPILVLSPMMPYLIHEGFHLRIFYNPLIHPRGIPWLVDPRMFFVNLCYSFGIGLICAGLSRMETPEGFTWGLSCGIVAFFLGFIAPPLVLLVGAFLLLLRMTPWRDGVSPYHALMAGTFLTFILLLILTPS